MTIENFLSRLDKVRQTAPNSWSARCPAHPDKTPSLRIKLGSDDKVLVHCFGNECSAEAITSAVGLTLADLFPVKPRRETGDHRPRREFFNAADVLAAVVHEITLVECAVGEIQRKGYLTDAECERLTQASTRLQTAVRLAGVDRHG